MNDKKVTIQLEPTYNRDSNTMPTMQLIITTGGLTDYEVLGMLEHAASIMKANIHYRQFKEKL